MSGVWGKKIKYSIFGESHGKGIGITIDGLPAGIKLDMEEIQYEMSRRAPGQDAFSTPRKEKDEVEILSGFFDGRTTGTPLCAIIWNADLQSKDYNALKDTLRPGHADFTGKIKYSGFNDFRGGGHFSGRLTAPLVFAGAIAKQILKEKGIQIGAHIYQIRGIYDTPFHLENLKDGTLENLKKSRFPLIEKEKGEKMKAAILEAKNEQDSVGGVVEGTILHLPAGLGEPFFDSVESLLAHMLFSIPAVKGVEFGTGFEITKMRGSEANDAFCIENGEIKTKTNHNGGILGGITTGMPLVFRVALKPTPSIAQTQKTVDFEKKEEVQLDIKGRHDPCIVPRALPVVEAAAAMVILELL